MTSDPTPLTDDELSAALDGDDALARRAASIPESAARLAAMTDARRLLAAGAPPVLAAPAVDDLVAAALDSPRAPSMPSSRRASPPGWLVAAVVVVLAAIGLTLVFVGRGSDDQQTATSSEATDQPAADQSTQERADDAGGATTSDGAIAAPEALSTAEADEAIGDVTYLGSFADAADLRTALATAFPQSSNTTTAKGSEAPNTSAIKRCADQLTVTLTLEDGPVKTGFADVDGRAVLVYEFATSSLADGQPTTLVAAVGVDACDQVTIFER